ncbi:6092_t:CDS:2 [Ambispora leptoticha]|uniref:6092_t:CDS:1 n=1 Tax=Ambispora leptoticha TaxID=144679 RepID=A0A9N8VEC7_9GLOM|nr:6092_t:CDS:2 [Ambispora leptoticha]
MSGRPISNMNTINKSKKHLFPFSMVGPTMNQQQVHAPYPRPANILNTIRTLEDNLDWENQPSQASVKMAPREFGGGVSPIHKDIFNYPAQNLSKASGGIVDSLYYDHLVNGGGSFSGLYSHEKPSLMVNGEVNSVKYRNNNNNVNPVGTNYNNKLFSIASSKPIMLDSAWESSEDRSVSPSISITTSRSLTPNDSDSESKDNSQVLTASPNIIDSKQNAITVDHINNKLRTPSLSNIQDHNSATFISSKLPPPINDELDMTRFQKARRDSNTTASSDPVSDNSDKSNNIEIEKEQKKATLYKTEMCRNWEEKGTCRYGTKCQFAHAETELRKVVHHPKYKTEICKTFWQSGTCPYGKRCCFIHNDKDLVLSKQRRNSVDSSLKAGQSGKAKELNKFKSDSELYGKFMNGSDTTGSPLQVPDLKSTNSSLREFTDLYFSSQSYAMSANNRDSVAPSTTSHLQDGLKGSTASKAANLNVSRERFIDGNLEDSDDENQLPTPPLLQNFLDEVVNCDEPTMKQRAIPIRLEKGKNNGAGYAASDLVPILNQPRGNRLAIFRNLG